MVHSLILEDKTFHSKTGWLADGTLRIFSERGRFQVTSATSFYREIILITTLTVIKQLKKDSQSFCLKVVKKKGCHFGPRFGVGENMFGQKYFFFIRTYPQFVIEQSMQNLRRRNGHEIFPFIFKFLSGLFEAAQFDIFQLKVMTALSPNLISNSNLFLQTRFCKAKSELLT